MIEDLDLRKWCFAAAIGKSAVRLFTARLETGDKHCFTRASQPVCPRHVTSLAPGACEMTGGDLHNVAGANSML